MVQITGKYELVKSENFASHLVSLGIPEDRAKAAEQFKPVYDIKHNGDNISIDIILDTTRHVELVLNKEVDEVSPFDILVKTTATLKDNTLTLNSKLPNGRSEIRIHKFSGNEVIVTYKDDNPAIPDAVRVFKRL